MAPNDMFQDTRTGEWIWTGAMQDDANMGSQKFTPQKKKQKAHFSSSHIIKTIHLGSTFFG